MIPKLMLPVLFLCYLQLARAQVKVPVEYLEADSMFRAGLYDSAQLLFSGLIRRTTNDSLHAEMLHRKGVMFFAKGESDSATYFEERALDKFSLLNVKGKMSNAAGNLALIYASKKIYDRSLFYNLASIRNAQTGRDSLRQYFNLFTLYQVQSKYDSAFELLVRHISIFPAGLLPNQAFLTALNFGLYYSNTNKHSAAIAYFRQSLPAATSSTDSTAAYNNISDEYRLLHNYPRAIAYLDSAVALTYGTANLEGRLACYDTYVSLYTDTRDYANALSFAQRARAISDTLFANGKANALLDASVKYEAEKKEVRLQLLAKDNLLKKRSLTYSFIGLLLLFILVLMIFRNSRQKQKANAILQEQKNKLEKLTEELNKANQTKLLLLSTIGHDLRSPLSSLYALLKMQELKRQDNAAGVNSGQVTGLLNVLENLLAWSKMNMANAVIQPTLQKVNLLSLLEEQQEFFRAKALEKHLQLQCQAPGDLTVYSDEYILSTILRNLVDNAIHYAETGSTVFLSAIHQPLFIELVVKNKSTEERQQRLLHSMETDEVVTGRHGMGLILVKRFCEFIHADISITYSEGYTVLSLQLPNSKNML
ncbi:MAG TPA: HAMP domain-containing sensor histidine kinase [Chitinophagaceae bacterium]|nr:HAMP domain-containing sensor histidine kinase [Chitinophagaceae bacterium]